MPFSPWDRDRGLELISWTQAPQILMLVLGFWTQVHLREVETIFSSLQVLRGLEMVLLVQQLRENNPLFKSSSTIIHNRGESIQYMYISCLFSVFWRDRFAKVGIQALELIQCPVNKLMIIMMFSRNDQIDTPCLYLSPLGNS